jgi:hypothetical protein
MTTNEVWIVKLSCYERIYNALTNSYTSLLRTLRLLNLLCPPQTLLGKGYQQCERTRSGRVFLVQIRGKPNIKHRFKQSFYCCVLFFFILLTIHYLDKRFRYLDTKCFVVQKPNPQNIKYLSNASSVTVDLQQC